jgi:chromosomal replication initiator protein
VWHSSFQDVRAIELSTERLRVAVPSSHVRERIEGRYLALVRDALSELGHPGLELAIDVTIVETLGPDPMPQLPLGEVGSISTSTGTGSAREGDTGSRPSALGLNPKYTFDNFVIGASNHFAHAAALRVAETPARSYNPLFIYGQAGLGKTHLLHAIGHYVHQNYAHHAVCYVSTETFLNEYVDAIRTNSTVQFKKRYREVDVLMIDDIQFMEGKEGLQEEFFHTFNSLHGANKQIVISSDRNPDAIQTLEDRLRGRFKWGLITDIQPPDLETRLAILRTKAEKEAVPIPPRCSSSSPPGSPRTSVSSRVRSSVCRRSPASRGSVSPPTWPSGCSPTS